MEPARRTAEFVRWWDGNVTPNRVRKSVVAEHGLQIPAHEAETRTGLSKRQVSRWRARLKERPKYMSLLFGADYRKAISLKGRPRLPASATHRKPLPGVTARRGRFSV